MEKLNDELLRNTCQNLLAEKFKLLATLENILGTTELNVDELEPDTIDALENARWTIMRIRGYV